MVGTEDKASKIQIIIGTQIIKMMLDGLVVAEEDDLASDIINHCIYTAILPKVVLRSM